MLTRLYCVAFIVILTLSQTTNCAEEKKIAFTKFQNCDLEKSSLEKSNECPPNSKCIDIGKVKAAYGYCICEKNYTVNENYLPSSDKNSVYCVERNNTLVNVTSTPVPTSASTSTASSSTSKIASTNTPTTQLPITSPPPTPSTYPTSSQPIPTKAPQVPTTQSTLNNKTSTPSPQATTKASKAENSTASPSTESTTTKSKIENNDAKPQAHHFLGGILLPLMFVLGFAGIAYGVKKYELIERVQTYIRNRRSVGQPHQTRYDGLENDFDDDPLLI